MPIKPLMITWSIWYQSVLSDSDYKGIEKDMPAWCGSTGHEFLGVEKENEEIKVYVRKVHD